MHSTANLPPLAILKMKVFSLKKIIFFFKKPKFWTLWEILNIVRNFEHCEKFYYFSRILRHIYCNLVKKNPRSESVRNSRNWPLSIRKQRKKKSDFTVLSGWFSFHIINLGGKEPLDHFTKVKIWSLEIEQWKINSIESASLMTHRSVKSKAKEIPGTFIDICFSYIF